MDEATLSFDFESELKLPPLATDKRRNDIVCRFWLFRRCSKDDKCAFARRRVSVASGLTKRRCCSVLLLQR